MRRVFCSFVAIAVFGAALAAQTAVAPPPTKVRSLYRAWMEVRSRVDAAGADLRDAPKDTERFRQASARVQELAAQAKTAQRAFEVAFAPSDWKQFDGKADAPLLRAGLPAVARDLQAPARAVAAGQLFVTAFPGDAQQEAVAGTALPMAMIATRDVAGARKVLDLALGTSRGAAKSKMLVLRGDLEAADGERVRAARCYELAEADAAAKEQPAIALRRALLGKPAPALEGLAWFGTEATTLAALRGKPVVLDFWASWCPPCRTLMPVMEELAKTHRAAGLTVLGVTRAYPNGYLPANREQLQSGGKALQGLDAERYREHVTAFRANTGLDYPFVQVGEADFERYRIRSIPTAVVIDRDGTVALAMIGASCEPLLRLAVERSCADGNR